MSNPPSDETLELWPALPLEPWQDTYATLQMWTQIVGKVRLTQGPWLNHSWHVTLYVTARGLTTGPMPHGDRAFQIDFDFIDHRLAVQSHQADRRELALRPQSVADFYAELMQALRDMNLEVQISTMPNEVAEPIDFTRDTRHASYDAAHANRFWRILVQSDRVLRNFRSPFIGKCSPVHFFWGSFDLAVTRFSGRAAPPHPGGIPNLPDKITREAYSQEVSSCGFWPGGGPLPFPSFYSYAYPEPPGFKDSALRPADAFYSGELREFILPYEVVRQAANPDEVLLQFLQCTYEAAANLAQWNREALERADTDLPP